MAQFKDFLMEGGNAVHVSSRINQRNVAATLEDIYKKVLPEFKISKSDTDKYVLLGSAGKKRDDDSSGDLDLAIDLGHVQKAFKLKSEEDALKKVQDIVTALATKMFKEHGHDGQTVKDFFKLMPPLLTFSFGYPITSTDGKQEGQFVQLDIMPVENIDYAGWAMGAPSHDQSNIKAAVRNILWSQIIKHIEMKVLDKDENGEPISIERLYFEPKKGLFKTVQQRQMGKSGKLTKQTRLTDKKLITSDKQKVVDMLFKGNHKAQDIVTFERLWELFNSSDFKYPTKREEIKNAFIETTKEMRQDLPKLS